VTKLTEGVGMNDFWRNKKVLITGHTGFKGSWLLSCLNSWGAETAGYSAGVPTEPSMFRLLQLEEPCRSFTGDLGDRERLNAVFGDFLPEIVFHLAAQTLVRRSYADPYETYKTNVLGTLNVLDAACEAEARVLVNVTTDKCYENKEWEWGYRENDPLGGDDPYSASKGCSEILTASWRKSFPPRNGKRGTAIATARAGNVVGGGDWAEDRLMPDCVRAFTSGRPLILRNPDAVRPWQHVLEPLGGYVALAERLWAEPAAYSGAWNFGPEKASHWPVFRFAEAVRERWGTGEIVIDSGENPRESSLLYLDSSKARLRLGWVPRLSLEETLDWSVEWYRTWARRPQDLLNLTRKQIATYGNTEKLPEVLQKPLF
jgi:CDP-glucose 4,6-dehydratase